MQYAACAASDCKHRDRTCMRTERNINSGRLGRSELDSQRKHRKARRDQLMIMIMIIKCDLKCDRIFELKMYVLALSTCRVEQRAVGLSLPLVWVRDQREPGDRDRDRDPLRLRSRLPLRLCERLPLRLRSLPAWLGVRLRLRLRPGRRSRICSASRSSSTPRRSCSFAASARAADDEEGADERGAETRVLGWISNSNSI